MRLQKSKKKEKELPVSSVRFDVYKDGRVTTNPYKLGSQYVPGLMDSMLGLVRSLNTAYCAQVNKVISEQSAALATAKDPEVNEAHG
jgi:hypothetical protein